MTKYNYAWGTNKARFALMLISIAFSIFHHHQEIIKKVLKFKQKIQKN